MKKLVLLVLCFSFMAGTLYAASDNYSLNEVVVTASRYKEPKKEVTANVRVITQKEIQASSAGNLGELLAEEGIGHIHMYPGVLTTVGIRGFRTDTHGNDLLGHVLILLDGRRAGTGNIAKILTKNIQRIEIIRGPAAVQYGSAGMGGVINVITKRGKGKPSAFIEGSLGSFGYEDGTIGSSGKYKKFDFSMAYSRSKKDDYTTAEGKRYYNTGIAKIEDYSINLGYEIFPSNRISMILTKFDADKVGNPSYLSQNDLDDYKNTSLDSADFIYEGQLPDMFLSWKVRYFQGTDKNEWWDPTASNPSGWDDGIPSTQYTDHKGAQAQISYNKDYLLITTGIDWVYYKIRQSWSPHRSYYKNPALFFLGKLRLFNDKLLLSGGIRYDKYKVEVGNGEGKDQKKYHLCPSVGVAYLLTDNIKLRAQYGQGYRMPGADQLAADYYSWGTHYVGNPDLKPEQNWTIEGGVDVVYDSFTASFTYFHTHYKDFIDTVVVSSGVKSYKNVYNGTIDGYEISCSVDLGKLLSLDYTIKPYGNIVYLLRYEDDNAKVDKALLYTDKYDASWGIYVSDKKSSFWGDLNFSYVGNQWIRDWESSWSGPRIKKKAFVVANLTLYKKLLAVEKYGTFSLKGEVKNLFNREYSYVKGYPMPGRSFILSLRYQF